ncbi:MAG: carbonic anhydrase family protein [Bacteroidetes bacterium]|nr:MAG: carbonic anhydrase family protein [Bacteroidota bacterium]
MTIRHTRLLLTLLAISFLLISCKEDELPPCTDIHWEYEGEDGPDAWGELCVDYTTCAGQAQSPVNLAGAIYDPASLDIAQSYSASTTHILNNGHTIQFTYDAGSSILVNGESYELLQFHSHTHSEHSVSGISSPMELHFVHKNLTTGNLAVIGVLVEEGAENEVLKLFTEHLPAAKDSTYEAALTYEAQDLFPEDRSYFTYSGSLTTPPCSEIVTWFVMEQSIQASAAQIEAFEALQHENARPLQELDGRVIRYHSW